MCRCIGATGVVLALAASGLADAPPFTRIDDARTATLPGRPRESDAADADRAISLAFEAAVMARHSQAVPGGGTLSPGAFMNPTTVNASGRVAFFAQVSGVARNQGIFTADADGLHPVIFGCGGGGGSGAPGPCGDPTPIGGTYAGLFGGTMFVPVLNDAGDVLFLADVYGGSAPRGLFLYRAAERDVIKIAAVGDASPMGGTISAVGPGSLNGARQIVFLARRSGSSNTHIFRWQAGVVTKVVAVGDAAPGGGTFNTLAGESLTYSDGTTIPVGAVPDINEGGLISFFGMVTGGLAERGIFVSQGGALAWYLSRNDPTPIGGSYMHFWGPILNNRDELAVYAEIQLGGGNYNSAWVVGTPGNWRKALAFYEPLDGGQVWGQAVSRNPLGALDDCGHLAAWCVVRMPDTTEWERQLVISADGTKHVVVREGEPTPLGGDFGTIQGWPAINAAGESTLGAATPGAGATLNAHFLAAIANKPGDASGDDLLTAPDWVEFQNVLAAPRDCAGDFGGRVFDFDGDVDVDFADAAAFQDAFGN